jgi:ABC-type phosphate transport system permease subunit
MKNSIYGLMQIRFCYRSIQRKNGIASQNLDKFSILNFNKIMRYMGNYIYDHIQTSTFYRSIWLKLEIALGLLTGIYLTEFNKICETVY